MQVSFFLDLIYSAGYSKIPLKLKVHFCGDCDMITFKKKKFIDMVLLPFMILNVYLYLQVRTSISKH